jgi:hypothetical protein
MVAMGFLAFRGSLFGTGGGRASLQGSFCIGGLLTVGFAAGAMRRTVYLRLLLRRNADAGRAVCWTSGMGHPAEIHCWTSSRRQRVLPPNFRTPDIPPSDTGFFGFFGRGAFQKQ